MENLRKIIREIVSYSLGLSEYVESPPQDMYVSMNHRNFKAYESELEEKLKDKLVASKGDFVKFLNSVVKKHDDLNPVLHDDMPKGFPYLDNLVSGGGATLKKGLYKIFSNHFGSGQKKNPLAQVPRNPCLDNVNLQNIRLVGPVVAKTDKDLMNKWLAMAGGKLYKVVLPDQCQNQLSPIEKAALYVTIEPEGNRIHFPSGVPDKLRGAELGKLIYLKVIERLGYITSSIASSPGVKTIYEDFIKNPKYKDRLYTLIIQKQILVIDRNAKLDLVSLFKEFVNGKYTEKKYVGISEGLKSILGKTYTEWYNSLSSRDEDENKAKYLNLEPEPNDIVIDVRDNRKYTFGGQNTLNKGKKNERTYIWLSGDNYKDKYIEPSEKKNLKVIFRPK